MAERTGLRYIGGGRWLHGVPARDLAAEEVEDCGGEQELVASGLYERPSGTKALRGPAENKSAETDGD